MLDYIVKCRRTLHQIPELETHLEKTCAFVKEQLSVLHCTVNVPAEGSLCAFFDAGRSSTIAFRADMDALPLTEQTGLPFSSCHAGRMHACGHDGHTAMLLGFARRVDALLPELPHNVLLIFQSAEENPGGAKPICDSGILTQCNVSAIFGCHLWPKLDAGKWFTRPGPMMAKTSEMDLTVEGKSVHISRYREGRDTIWAACEFLRRAYAMESSALPPDIPRLLRFGRIEGGRVRNAVAAHTVVEGALRAFTMEHFDLLRRRCEEIAEAAGQETGCDMTLSFSDGYPPVTNDAALLENINACLGADAPQLLPTLSLAAEDFAWYQRFVPGVFFFLGVGDTEELHSPRFTFDESILEKGPNLFERLLYLTL